MKNAKDKQEQKSVTLKERYDYWFDNRTAKGSFGLIRVLIAASVALALVIAGLIILFGFNEEGEIGSVFWDSIATVINAWMPYFDEGSLGYLILMSVIAIAGLLFTSVLIGIITSAIEEKIYELKKGNSAVLEKGHIVVLGFYPGEYTLIRQLILAAEGKPACIVVADNMERDEIETNLKESVDIPKNVKIICRTANITDPDSLEKCSIDTCKTVIISPTEDTRTIKAILAVSVLLQRNSVSGVRINALISKREYRFPLSLAQQTNISTFQTNDILAKMIAHSCTQMGLSETFRELFNFEGSEFYLLELPEIAGHTFEEAMIRLDHAVPAGVLHDDKIKLNPSADYIIQDGDRILVFSEESTSARLTDPVDIKSLDDCPDGLKEAEDTTSALIIGHNETLPIILQELPENVSHVYIAEKDITDEEKKELQDVADGRNLALEYYNRNFRSESQLLQMAKVSEHIVILSDHDEDPEKADMDNIFLLLNLRDIRTRYDLQFNITVEMQKEHNQNLVGEGDHTDFLVASSMSSLFLAQLAESPELIDVFREILSNKGNEVYLKNAEIAGLAGTHTIRELRQIVLRCGYILLGYVDAEKSSHFDLLLDDEITLHPEDDIIVLGEK